MSAATIPAIIYGTAWKKEQTQQLVTDALMLGYRGIDTACQPKHYDEAAVGRGVTAALHAGLTRAELYLQTKFTSESGQDPRSIPYDPQAPLAEQVASSFATSLRNLQTTYLDCLVLHSPLADATQTAHVWEAMEGIVAAGTVRSLGISNCYSPSYLEDLYRTARVKPAVVQNRFYADTRYDREIRAFCKDHGITYQSFWTLTANPHLLGAADVRALGTKYRRTSAQILFRYLTLEGVVPLTGAKSAAHLREDLEIFEFELTKAERDRLTALL